MPRTDIKWAANCRDLVGNPPAEWALGAPDGDEWVCVGRESATFDQWSRASHDDLGALLAGAEAGDAVTPDMLASADFIAWELNGPAPAPGGGWESCQWQFRDDRTVVDVAWREGDPGSSPRDRHVVASGSVTGDAYGRFFGIPDRVITQYQPAQAPEELYFSYLLLRLRDDLDVQGSAFTATLSPTPPDESGQAPSPDVDALGVLVPADAQPAKPKRARTTRAQAVRKLCQKTSGKDALTPALAVLWELHRAGITPRNEAESAVWAILDGLDQRAKDAVDAALTAFASFRDARLDKCGLFDLTIADTLRVTPLDRDRLAGRIVENLLPLVADQMHPNSGGKPGAGLHRDWVPPARHSGELGDFILPRGPWPWLTAVREKGNITDFGSRSSFILPGNPPAQWSPKPEQLAVSCSAAPVGADGTAQMVCTPIFPTPQASGGGFGGTPLCEGGLDYTVANHCLRIPEVAAGTGFTLRGFNFTSPDVTVHLRREDDVTHAVYAFPHVQVWGDVKRALLDDTGAVNANFNVDDEVDVTIPVEDPKHAGSFFPDGLYSVWVSVDQSTDPPQPGIHDTNALLLRVLPPAEARVIVNSPSAHCVKKTDSFLFASGDDEIWWATVVGKAGITKVEDQDRPFTLSMPEAVTTKFPAWAGVDDGESIVFPPAPVVLHDGPLAPHEILCVGVLGLEVDSEDAARQHLASFWNSFELAWKRMGEAALGVQGILGGGFLAGLVGAGIAAGLGLVVAAIAVRVTQVVMSLVAIWSIWAAPEVIALDAITLDSRQVTDLTNPRTPPPPPASREFGSEGEHIRVGQAPLGPKSTAVQSAPYDFQIEYQAEDPGSRYQLQFRLLRATS